MDTGSTQSPRVCMLIESYVPIVGGMESQGRALSAGLAARGIEHQIVTRRVTADLPAFERIGGIAVTRIGPVGTGGSGRWRMTLTALPWLLRHRHDYDVLLVAGFRTLGLAAVLARKLTGKPCVLKADSRGEMSGAFFAAGLKRHGLSPDAAPVRLLLKVRRKWLKRADAFVSLSAEMTEEIQLAGVRPERIHKIPNAVDTRVFAPVSDDDKQTIRRELDIAPDRVVFVYTGRLVTYKGLPTLFDAWRRFQAGDDRLLLLIVGGGGQDMHNCEQRLRDFVMAHELASSIRFVGETTRVYRYLQAADVFVFPTEEEAFGLSLIEAMACGLPSISTTVGGLREILRHGHNGIAVGVGDAAALEAAMRHLLRDPVQRVALGSNAIATVAAHYALDRVCDRYLAVFKAVVETASARGRVG